MIRASSRLAWLAVASLFAVAGCGGGQSNDRSSSRNDCRAAIGLAAPLGRPLGREQLVFAQLAIANDDSSNHTRIRLLSADTQLDPARASAISDQLVARPAVVAVVGPATSGEVEAVGTTFARGGIPFVSASATGPSLTGGTNPTFFRVVAPENLQGPQLAQFVVTRLHPRAVEVLDDGSGASRQLAASVTAFLRGSRVPVAQVSVTGRGAVASATARVTPATAVVVLAWKDALAAQQLGQTLFAQHKPATLVASAWLYAPGVFTTPGSYVVSPGPDITQIPADAAIVRQARRSLPRFGTAGPLAYAATHVIDDAIASVCRSGRTPSRSDVLAAIRATNQGSSILGVPVRFRPDGNLVDARWFLFRIDARRNYRLQPGS